MNIPNPVICALDLGSKNFKLVCGYQSDGRIHTRLLNKTTLNLGKEIVRSGGKIGAKKLAEVERVLAGFAEYGHSKMVSKFPAIATSAVHEATNGQELLAIARKLGIDLEIADGQREGEVGYLAATHGRPNRLVTELGSRSCQIAWHDGDRIRVQRIELGYQAAYERFFHGAETFAPAATAFRAFLTRNLPQLPRSTQEFVALAANSMAAFANEREPTEIAGHRLPHQARRRRIEELHSLEEEDFQALKHHMEKADKILPCLVFVDHLLRATGHRHVSVSRAELPVGLIVEHFQRNGWPPASLS